MKAWHRTGDVSPRGPHRISVYAVQWEENPPTWAWYTGCNGCTWEPDTRYTWPDGSRLWARPNWDAAFALGVAHLREAACKHV